MGSEFTSGYCISIGKGNAIGKLREFRASLARLPACSLPELSTWAGVHCKVQDLWPVHEGQLCILFQLRVVPLDRLESGNNRMLLELSIVPL
ncbi:hypothetical protein TNCV_1299871 [Trichonephila clavipes]|nr:hypothetical protein TNCV_1299871 [Trichonephila clavipes]